MIHYHYWNGQEVFKSEFNVKSALAFAADCHFKQERKYTGEPYVVHPIAVAADLINRNPSFLCKPYIQAALLHDVVEDCGIPIGDIMDKFGIETAWIVGCLTEPTNIKGNRKFRKDNEAKRLCLLPWEIQYLKVLDLMDNTKTIKKYDPNFWRVYREEKEEILEGFIRINAGLPEKTYEIINLCYEAMETICYGLD